MRLEGLGIPLLIAKGLLTVLAALGPWLADSNTALGCVTSVCNLLSAVLDLSLALMLVVVLWMRAQILL